MKLKNILMMALAFTMALTACDQGLEDLNKNPNAVEEMDPGYLFAYTQLTTSGERYENWRANLIYSSCMIQHLAATAGYWSGNKYFYNAGYSSSLWDRAYKNYIKELTDLLQSTAEDPEDVNKLACTRIWRVVAMHRLTDLYGDVPYSEAGLGYLDQITSPKYDPQQEIYMDMLKELDEAAGQLDDSKPSFGSQDLIYQGNVAKWRKLAYSMMLRLGMRLTKVSPAEAETWVKKAIEGGVMDNNDDLCYIMHQLGPEGINKNGIGEVWTADDNQKLSDTFIDWLKDNNDPRLMIISGGVAKESVDLDKWNTDIKWDNWKLEPDDQVGLPNRFDADSLEKYGIDNFHRAYSRVNPKLAREDSPMFFQTYAEVEYLLAEAAVRGWNADGDAATHYENGVRAAMSQYVIYDPTLAVEDDDVTDYLNDHPFDGSLEMIGEQYWAATFLNEYESYANWRRTGFPELIPVNYPGNESGGQIPRRLRYPVGEASINAESYQEAITRQGPDIFTTRIWWDKE